jgi:DNA-binding HxlR family transcriptional regulator
MPNESKPNRKISEHLRVCPVRGVIDIISKKWAFLIINALGNSGRLTFNALIETLAGTNPKTLSNTLKILEKEGFVRKESFNEIPPISKK